MSKFNDYYQEIYGDRWPLILQAMRNPERQIARWNRWAGSPSPEFSKLEKCHSKAYWQDSKFPIVPGRGENDLLNVYIMDPASDFVARQLPIQAGDKVLDMCAAPGGKSLILMEALDESGELIANEPSAARRDRLTKVIQQYVPREKRDRLWVTGKEGVAFGLKHPQEFDQILVDAPCSGERHLLQNEKELSQWTKKRGEGLAHRQYALICSALLAVKPKGYILYSTCSVNPLENEKNIEKLLKKKKGEVEVVPVSDLHPDSEAASQGYYFLPDRCGYGPMYFCLLRKTESGDEV